MYTYMFLLGGGRGGGLSQLPDLHFKKTGFGGTWDRQGIRAGVLYLPWSLKPCITPPCFSTLWNFASMGAQRPCKHSDTGSTFWF